MFTVTDSAASDYTFDVLPTEAGTVSPAGVLTLSDDASGTVTVKATHGAHSEVTATTSFTGIVAKTGS